MSLANATNELPLPVIIVRLESGSLAGDLALIGALVAGPFVCALGRRRDRGGTPSVFLIL